MNPQDDYISIAEFAKLAGMTPAGVYKRVNKPVDNELINYIKMVDGKKRINKAALSLFTNESSQPVYKPVDKPVDEVYKPVDSQLINSLQGTLDVLKGQLEKKDIQIDYLQDQLKTQAEQSNKQIEQLNDRLQEAHQLNHQNQILLSENKQPQPIEAPPATVKSPRRFWPFKRKGVDKE